jgi:hypothetical protein
VSKQTSGIKENNMSSQLEKPPIGEGTMDRAGSGGTSAVCQYSGPYKCSTHPDTIVVFQKGQSFTVCPMSTDSKKAGAGHPTTWAMVRETDASSFDVKVQRGATEL